MSGTVSLGASRPDRVVPPSGFTAWLTMSTAGAMAFLAVFALALSMASARVAERWSEALARTATVRISAPEGQVEAQVQAALLVLETTPGVRGARRLTRAEEEALLAPWFGPDLPLDTLPIPALIEVIETASGIDAVGLRARLAGEVPGAVFDDHTRWREPLVRAAGRLRGLAGLSLVLIAAATAGMITLAAQASLAANARVIQTLRLVGATDRYIAGAFVRRFTLRAFVGAGVGTLLGTAAIALLPQTDTAGGFLTSLGLQGAEWLRPLALPLCAAVVALVATWIAAFRQLREVT